MAIIDKDRNSQPGYKELIISKLLVVFGIYAIIIFMLWLLNASFQRDNFLYTIIIISFSYKVISYIYEWLLVWHPSVPKKPKWEKDYTVDVLTTYVKGEPKELIKESLLAIKSITYPHRSFLCDEADDPELKAFCAAHDIEHVTRVKKVDAKAGNINNALRTVANGEIVLILDPDHIVYPNFLDEVLPYFEDEEMGFVQVVQAYSNQYETVIAKAAAEQTYQFYGPVMMTLNSYGAVPAIGANCTFRRTALDSIGGHAPGLTEDMHTTLKLKAKGWKSVYNPVIVAEGLVPWNFSGYSLQQLKWSRGTFDLLFNAFPKAFKNLSWTERLAFLTVPLFYLSGIIAFIDFLIPIIALLFSIIPINLNVVDFIIYYFQLYFVSQVIRYYHQRWYYKQHEKGTALLGGILFKTTWWSTVLGFIYSLINKKVPYIPTPKDFRHETPWKLLLPNFTVIGISIYAIVYGLNHDLTPFSLFMAFLAFLNILILGTGSFMAMQKQIVWLHKRFRGTFISKDSSARRFMYRVRHSIYNVLHKNYIVVFSLLFVLFGNIAIIKITPQTFHQILTYGKFGLKLSEVIDSKSYIYKRKYGQLYVGAEHDNVSAYSKADVSFIKQDFYLNQSKKVQFRQFLDSCYTHNILPFLSLSVDSSYRWSVNDDHELLTLQGVYTEIKKRYMPVIIMLDRSLNSASEDHYESYLTYSHLMADSMAVNSLITRVWHSNNIDNDLWLLPGYKNMIDWVYAENEGAYLSKNSYYGKHRESIRTPLLINTSNIENRDRVDFDSGVYVNNVVGILGANSTTPGKLSYTMAQVFKKPTEHPANRLVLPNYVKGMGYNPGRGGGNNNDLPLTVEKLQKDFTLINEMGCNTIRRFDPSVYDYNLLKMAKAHDIDVLYGFWFENEIDYFKDDRRKSKYRREALRAIDKCHNEASIIGWGFGNETWYRLNERYGQPYLSIVRASYLTFINNLLQEVKALDKNRPVFIVENQYSSSMHAVAEYVPFVDFYGVNSYYGKGIDELKQMAAGNLKGIPYLVTEYGNRGPWDKVLNQFDAYNNILEPTSKQKAKEFAVCWNDRIVADSANNLGGIAFCWQDRYEGTATWFGVLDIFGNKKPAYYALKDAYSDVTNIDSTISFPIPEFDIQVEYDTLDQNRITVTAVNSENGEYCQYRYKWLLYDKQTSFGNTNVFSKVVETDFRYDNTVYSFKVPYYFNDYRIYLYVQDDRGNGITNNAPIISWVEASRTGK